MKTEKSENSTSTSLKSSPTAQVTGKPGKNTSTLSGRHNPNKPKPEGGAQPAPTNSPGMGTDCTNPSVVGGMPKK